MAASKSKYCPVAANVALKEILNKDGKYAVVGLPCHIHGLRKAQAVNKKLRERVVLSIGLFCSHNDSFFSRDYLLRRFKVEPHNASGISYRGKGWPGILRIEQTSGKAIECPFHDWIQVHEYCFFTPDRCLVCCDHAAELADIATGDAWLAEYSQDTLGASFFISRNLQGDKILQLAKSKGNLIVNPASSRAVVKSQGNVRFKKNGFHMRSFLFKLQGKCVPHYVVELPKTGIVELPRSVIIFINRKLASKDFFNKNLERLISLQVALKKLYALSSSKGTD
jgi:coenzyme F420 hydrogenase subunit beta